MKCSQRRYFSLGEIRLLIGLLIGLLIWLYISIELLIGLSIGNLSQGVFVIYLDHATFNTAVYAMSTPPDSERISCGGSIISSRRLSSIRVCRSVGTAQTPHQQKPRLCRLLAGLGPVSTHPTYDCTYPMGRWTSLLPTGAHLPSLCLRNLFPLLFPYTLPC